MPRLVRKAPLAERIKAYMDPMDWLMWASEELNSNDWDEFAKNYANWLGFGLNLVFMVAKANAGKASSDKVDDVFGDYQRSGGWLKWFAGLIITVLTMLSFSNAVYTFYRKRHYRLFEQNIDTNPATPSAQRVRVDSSPMAPSPLRLIQNIFTTESAEARAHPDAARDVWEVAIWDPNPLCLQLFCLFSPLHVLLYYFTLPVAPLDPQPSVKIVTTVAIAAFLSLQLFLLRSSFSQQIKDSAVIQRQVLSEYDTKFVHPLVQKPCRDVAIQTITASPKRKTRDSGVGVSGSDLASEIVTYTPTIIISRNWRTKPNTAYASQYDPDNLASQPEHRQLRSSAQTPSIRPSHNSNYTSTSTATASGADFSSPIRASNTPNPFQKHTQFKPRQSNYGSGDGGSLGVYSHAASPLRKAASANYLREERARESVGGGERRRDGSPTKRDGSPLKRSSTPGGFTGNGALDLQGKGYSGLGVGRRESGRF
ncbi:hypothetical protein EJ04DRAFT_581825 [Polyplosphaeria fusca]|uniref:Meiotically up-regulated gene 154 protein n=1 Tax=Polyplosphaeria fusca TaxID=682080 RepID=A0A9P4QL68_9PLEO|nr:hypothetical protein EJ04DRAFT_581825 [Polyplosphaeria fusca]